jgi:hypothetical protein
VEDTNVPNDNVLVDKVKINLNMFDALVLNWVELGRKMGHTGWAALKTKAESRGLVCLGPESDWAWT